MKKNFNWFEGAYEGIPSQDNGLESYNRNIKDYHTLRQRLNLPKFLDCLVNIVYNWSKDRDSLTTECKLFFVSPFKCISTLLWTSAFQFGISNIHVISTKSIGGVVDYFLCSDKKLFVTAILIT